MKIKRYFAPDIRQAIRQVREELGADAVILSNRRLDDGVEIVAAQDFDEQALLDRGQPDTRPPPAAPREEETPRMPAEAKRRAEDVFREALGKFAPEARTEPRPAQAAPSPRRAEPTAPAQKPARGQPAAERDPAPRRAETPTAARPAPPRYAERPQTSREPIEPPPARPAQPRYQERAYAAPEPAEPAPQPRYPGRGRPEPEDTGRYADRPPPPRYSERAQVEPEELDMLAPRHAGRAQIAMEEPDRYADPPRPAERPRAAETADIGALAVLHREIRQMRRVLDTHLGETRWNAEAERAPARLDLLRGLNDMGFSKKVSLELAERAGLAEDFETAWRHSQDILARRIALANDNLLDYGGVVALVGPTGVGKTTTIAKLAARFRMKHGSRQVALITTDNYRIGAHEQLGTYGRILDVPVRTAGSLDELRHHLAGFYDRRLVLIDTAGMGPRDMRLAEQIALFGRSEMPIRSYLVLSAASQLRAMREAIDAFGGFAPEASILTKLDETEQLGTALSALIEYRLPVAFLCDGQQVPEDIHIARAPLLLERCFAAPTDPDATAPGPLSYEDWVSHAHL